jgi:ribose transport system substrate-binding protein
MCGSKPIRVAHLDGFGGNTWRKTVRGELKDELSACKNITVDYTDAGGDLQKYISGVNSASAQGYDIILTFDDFGAQALSALTNAKKAGAVVATYVADPQGKLGGDYDVFVPYGFKAEGEYMAKWLAKLVKPGKGNTLFTGGLAGGSVPTVALMDAMVATNSATGAPLKFLTAKPVPSGWDPATMQKAMAGALASYPQIDAYASDYGVADLGALRAYLAAGRQIPPWATSASDNELGCLWIDKHAANPNWQLLTMDGTTSTVRLTIRKALAKLQGLPDTFPNVEELIPFVDTANGKLPTCQKDFPPDADLSANLTKDQLKAVFSA